MHTAAPQRPPHPPPRLVLPSPLSAGAGERTRRDRRPGRSRRPQNDPLTAPLLSPQPRAGRAGCRNGPAHLPPRAFPETPGWHRALLVHQCRTSVAAHRSPQLSGGCRAPPPSPVPTLGHEPAPLPLLGETPAPTRPCARGSHVIAHQPSSTHRPRCHCREPAPLGAGPNSPLGPCPAWRSLHEPPPASHTRPARTRAQVVRGLGNG